MLHKTDEIMPLLWTYNLAAGSRMMIVYVLLSQNKQHVFSREWSNNSVAQRLCFCVEAMKLYGTEKEDISDLDTHTICVSRYIIYCQFESLCVCACAKVTSSLAAVSLLSACWRLWPPIQAPSEPGSMTPPPHIVRHNIRLSFFKIKTRFQKQI